MLIIVGAAQRHAEPLFAVVKYDSKEYTAYSGEGLANRLSTGKQPLQTVVFTVVDAYKMKWTFRTSGKLTGWGTVALTRDGKTMIDSNRAFNPERKQSSLIVRVTPDSPVCRRQFRAYCRLLRDRLVSGADPPGKGEIRIPSRERNS